MGWKKRGGGSRSKNLPTPSPAAEKAVEEEKTEAHITSEIARAEKASERGNHRRALMIMKELSSRNPSSARVHFSHGGLICMQAKSIKDPTAKKRYLKNALEPVQRAMSLDPDELKYFCFYPSLVFDLASNADAYREVMQVAERTRQRLQERGLVHGILTKNMQALFLCSRYIVRQLEQKNVNFDDEEFKHKYMANAMRKMRQIKAKSEAVRVTQKTLQSMDFQEEEEEEEEEEMTLGARMLERRKTLTNMKKLTALGDKITQVQGYWNSLSADTKRGLLKVRICDLKEHFIRFANNDLAVAVLSEAIGFLQENGPWKFMECCVCAEKFTDLLLYVEHFANEHMGGLSERLNLFLPQEIDSDWVDIIEKGGWKPEDARAILQISEDELKRKSSSHVECTVMDMDVHLQNCIKDPPESYSVEEMKKQFDEMLMEAEIGNQNDEKSGKHEPEGSEWPFPDYPRRAKTLAKIQGMLQMLLKGRYLSRTHVLQVIRYTLEELQIFASELQLRNLGLDNTLLGICLLEFPQLEKVLRFLHSIAYICGITKFPEEGGAPAGAQKSEMKETIGVSVDSSYLLLDERLVTGELDVSTSNDSISNEASGSTFSLEDHDDDTLPGSGIFVPWLFVGRSVEEKLASWACLLDDRKDKKIEVLGFLNKEFPPLGSLCNMKIVHSANEEELKKIRSTCDDELKRSAQDPAYVPQHLEYLSKRRKEVHEVADVDDTPFIRHQLDLLSNLLEEADDLRKAIRKYEVQTTLELCRIDARITRILAAMQHGAFKVGEASARAYRSIMVFSLKSFIGAHLEDLTEKDATEKASAAEEALLADLALDAEKGVDTGDGKEKQTQKKSKNKKKNKYYRKSEDLKASSCGKQFLPDGKDVEQQELRCQVELDAEERRIELTFESPSEQNKLGERIEHHSSDETAIGTISPGGLQKQESSSAAKQKTTSTDEVPLILPLLYEKLGEGKSVSSKGSDDGPSVSKQLAYHKSAPLPSSDSSSDGSNEADYGDSDHKDSENSDQDDVYDTYHNFAESSERVPQGGAGLENYANDCSLNAIIQSLWHLRWFRRELMKSTTHLHMVDDACVYCSLISIFSLLNLASISSHKKATSPGPLRDALSNLDPQSNLYKKGEMNDASEILNKILEGLHLSFSTKKEESNSWESWDQLDCPSDLCITHSLFGIKIRERVACYHCGCESRQHAYNSLFHLINASELRKKKITHMDSSFDKLLKLVKMDDQVTCNPEEGGCGKLNSIDQILSDPPHLFVVLLGWQSVSENSEDVSTTLAALTTEIDIAVIYGDLDEGRKHHLISMVCFHSRHLTCFAYDHEHKNWVHYNDTIVEVIGHWNDVVTKCQQGKFQPQLLFYEAPLDE